MNLLPRRSLLGILAVLDVALRARSGAIVSAKSLNSRHRLPPRHMETLLQGLVHARILKGVRGPRGGYTLAGNPKGITVGEIVRAVANLSAADPDAFPFGSDLLAQVIEPAIGKAGQTFIANLDALTIASLCESTDARGVFEDENSG